MGHTVLWCQFQVGSQMWHHCHKSAFFFLLLHHQVGKIAYREGLIPISSHAIVAVQIGPHVPENLNFNQQYPVCICLTGPGTDPWMVPGTVHHVVRPSFKKQQKSFWGQWQVWTFHPSCFNLKKSSFQFHLSLVRTNLISLSNLASVSLAHFFNCWLYIVVSTV